MSDDAPPAGDTAPADDSASTRRDFIRTAIDEDATQGRFPDHFATRFPPEPNGYLHIGHAKSICLNFGLAQEYGGTCNLRFDDTNPVKEDTEYVDSIREDVAWLGFEWSQELYASDYFEQIYQAAEALIEKGLAYVDSQSAEEIRETRGTLTTPGTNSPHRERSVEENLKLFRGMRAGEFEDGAHVLRAKIDMASPNFNLRDPALYRIRRAHHHRTGDAWCIYPMYDWAHGISDSIEKITYSICTLEFENHRPLYDWFLETLGMFHPQQIEFARLNLTHTMMSKRRLKALVDEGVVEGWDDPRMPTIAGIRRRGVTPAAIRAFCKRIGVAKYNSTVDVMLFQHVIRDDLNKTATRVLAVLDPIKLVITNFPEGEEEWFEAVNNPEDESAGTRQIPFSRELWIEREDFREEANKKFRRLTPGKEVRLRYACFVTCTDFVKDDAGKVTEVHCTWDPESRGGKSPDGRKVKGTIHWVSAKHAQDAEVRLYDHLFSTENPDEGKAEDRDWRANLNPESLKIAQAKVEPSLAEAEPGARFQFERLCYVCRDSKSEGLVFNRTVGLRDVAKKKVEPAGGGGGQRKNKGGGKKRERKRGKGKGAPPEGGAPAKDGAPAEGAPPSEA